MLTTLPETQANEYNITDGVVPKLVNKDLIFHVLVLNKLNVQA